MIALPLLLGSSAIARTWYPLEVFDKANVNENLYADIESIKKTGDGDDFWHITIQDKDGLMTIIDFDCYSAQYFPNGEAPSAPVPDTEMMLNAYALACSPPSQTRDLLIKLSR